MLKAICAALVAAGLSGCVTAEQAADAEQARFRAFNGASMADFMASAMVVPQTHFDTAAGRVFVADKRAPDPAFGCVMHITTRSDGVGDGPEHWIITGIRRQGGCAHV